MVTLSHVYEVFSATGQVRFNGERFTARKEGIVSPLEMYALVVERTGRECELVELHLHLPLFY